MPGTTAGYDPVGIRLDPDLSTEIPLEAWGVTAGWHQCKIRVSVCCAYLISCYRQPWKKPVFENLFIFNTFYLQQEDMVSTARYCTFSHSSTYFHTKDSREWPKESKGFFSPFYIILWCDICVCVSSVCVNICIYVCLSVCLNSVCFPLLSLASIGFCAAFVNMP